MREYNNERTIPVPTFTEQVAFIHRPDTGDNRDTTNQKQKTTPSVSDLAITDHPAIFSVTPIGTIASLNVWCPTTPIAPPKNPNKQTGRWELHEKHHQQQMKLMAKYIFDILKSGVVVIALQEMPNVNNSLFIDSNQKILLSELTDLVKKDSTEPKIILDRDEIKASYLLMKNTDKFGNMIIANHAQIKSVSKPTPALGGRCAVHEIRMADDTAFALHNIHGDFTKQDQTIQYCEESANAGGIAAGDLNTHAAPAAPNATCVIESIGSTVDVILFNPDALSEKLSKQKKPVVATVAPSAKPTAPTVVVSTAPGQNGAFIPFRVDFQDGDKKAISAIEQAKKILDEVALLHAAGFEKVGITYSADQAQTTKINTTYKTSEWNTGTSGANQAEVMAATEQLLKEEKYRHLQSVFRIIPITTMDYKKKNNRAEDNDVNDCLSSAEEFLKNGGALLGWQNQLSNGDRFAIGGGVAAKTQPSEQKDAILRKLLEFKGWYPSHDMRDMGNENIRNQAFQSVISTYALSIARDHTRFFTPGSFPIAEMAMFTALKTFMENNDPCALEKAYNLFVEKKLPNGILKDLMQKNGLLNSTNPDKLNPNILETPSLEQKRELQ
ncbi:MAG: hypothetical protein NTZ67_01990 [Gammaproteobacteria bacterium]|nr:hypothetical protein [Gammaproteobacteria bacterium]